MAGMDSRGRKMTMNSREKTTHSTLNIAFTILELKENFKALNHRGSANHFYDQPVDQQAKTLASEANINLPNNENINFRNSLILSLYSAIRSNDNVLLDLSGTSYESAQDIIEVGLNITTNNKEKTVIYFQGNTYKYNFPDFAFLTFKEQDNFSFKDWISKVGINNERPSFSLKRSNSSSN